VSKPFSPKARKRFGQNFLHDRNVILNIVAAIAPHYDDQLVEIGPGLGALTTHLLPLVAKMTVIELDRDLIPILAAKCEKLGQLKIYQQDILKFDFQELTKTNHSLRIVGNLPYNISTPLLFHLFAQKNLIHDMYFMLQKEVAQRLAAQPGTKQYGRLTVMAQYHCQIQTLFLVPPSAFNPIPKVDSMFVRLNPTVPTVAAIDLKILNDIIKQSFSQRRKTLHNSLKSWINDQQLLQLGIAPSQRPEELSVANFVRISNIVAG
jgi:16S rRNA (adenine1518-N6/adenine1519-N6)-dimethyltransferase